MRRTEILILAGLCAAALTGCSATYRATAGYAADDLYAVHDKGEIAGRQQAQAEARRAEAEAQRAEWEVLLAEARALGADVSVTDAAPEANPYQGVLADTYESAYARRLRGFESPSYRMPSSYFEFRYGDAFTYVSAYDPAFYNIVISGDQVWVEPKYITSMFGSWGGTVYPGTWGFGPSYYGWWGAPQYGWPGWHLSVGYYPWYNPWYNPWHYDPWWGPGWHAPGWGHHRPRPVRPGGYDTGRGGGSYNTGRGGSYNAGRGSYNTGRSSYRVDRSGSYNSGRSDRNDGSRRPDYNQGYNTNRSNYNGSYNSGRSTGSYGGGGYNSGRGSAGSYNRGR